MSKNVYFSQNAAAHCCRAKPLRSHLDCEHWLWKRLNWALHRQFERLSSLAHWVSAISCFLTTRVFANFFTRGSKSSVIVWTCLRFCTSFAYVPPYTIARRHCFYAANEAPKAPVINDCQRNIFLTKMLVFLVPKLCFCHPKKVFRQKNRRLCCRNFSSTLAQNTEFKTKPQCFFFAPNPLFFFAKKNTFKEPVLLIDIDDHCLSLMICNSWLTGLSVPSF